MSGLYGDFSKWQVSMDWTRAKSAGIEGAFLRVSLSDYYVDPMFSPWRIAARAVGIGVGGYHYYYPGVLPLRQAALFCATIGAAGLDLPPVVDVEATSGWTHDRAQRLGQFLDYVQDATGMTPMIYTSQSVWATYMSSSGIWARRYPLWIANYRSDAGPLVPYPWTPNEWAFWQYTEKFPGDVVGAGSTYVDMNELGAAVRLAAGKPAERMVISEGTEYSRATVGDWARVAAMRIKGVSERGRV